MFPSNMEDKAVLLQLTVPFATFARVKVPVTVTQARALGSTSESAKAGLAPVDAHTAKLHEVSNAVLLGQGGGCLVAYPCSAGHCQVVCHKVCFAVATASAVICCDLPRKRK